MGGISKAVEDVNGVPHRVCIEGVFIEEGGLVRPGTIWAQYDKKMFEFPSDNATDDRIYLQAASPRPATVLAITFTIETSG